MGPNGIPLLGRPNPQEPKYYPFQAIAVIPAFTKSNGALMFMIFWKWWVRRILKRFRYPVLPALVLGLLNFTVCLDTRTFRRVAPSSSLMNGVILLKMWS